MRKRNIMSKIHSLITVKSTVYAGIFLLVLVMAAAGYTELKSTEALAEETMATLKQQCMSYNKLTAADRTKSLYRLSDLMRDFRTHLVDHPERAADAYLEEYVDSMRLTGISLLDGELNLEASGYTRQYRDGSWMKSEQGSHFADILQDRQKIYTERIAVDGEYYDTCVLARLDAPGILIGIYHQPAGLISNTETDLESLLSGLQLERSGHYIIAEDGAVRASSDGVDTARAGADSARLEALSQIPRDGRLHLFYDAGTYCWGYHSGCEQYSLYLYYPLVTLFSGYISAAAIFAAIYCAVCLMYFAVRNQALYENQEKLRKSNQGLEQTVKMLKALETIYFSLFYVDAETGTYRSIYVAPWLKEKIPESGDYAALRKLFVDHMVVPEYRDAIDRQMAIANVRENLHQKNLTEVRKSFYVDYKAVRGNRTPWCRVTSTPVDYDGDGNPLHFLALIQDIDREKGKEEAYQARILKEAQDAKVANNAKTEFLRRISHDIRTPINGIQGYMELAASHPEDTAMQAHCREKATAALQALLELLNSVMDMSKLESGDIVPEEKPFDLGTLLENANTVLEPQAKARNVRYEAVSKGEAPIYGVIGSPRHVYQIILNIASNAIKYTNPGGSVRVSAEMVSKTDEAVSYAFTCEDNGIGMSEEFQKHMYEPFSQEAVNARTTYMGTGLGLSIVKKMVDALGGSISCQSQRGRGTTFTVHLTFRRDEKAAAPEMPAREPDMDSLRDKRVMLVEDNELNMEIAAYFLVERGAVVTKAWNGKEAVDAFSASLPGDFDLILMDIMMPQMGGREATRTIRAMDRADAGQVPIVAMSANSFVDDIQKNLEAGMNAHISKPVDMKQILSVVGALFQAQCAGEMADAQAF